MSGFLERLTGLIHWASFLLTLYISFLFLTESVNMEPLIKIFLALLPNMFGWAIKYIFTGNQNFFPW